MRGSELEVVSTMPVMETQSWDEEFWKVSWAVLEEARSVNLLEWMLARKRKSGPTRWGEVGGLVLGIYRRFHVATDWG